MPNASANRTHAKGAAYVVHDAPWTGLSVCETALSSHFGSIRIEFATIEMMNTKQRQEIRCSIQQI
jgi:hypothetical protein